MIIFFVIFYGIVNVKFRAIQNDSEQYDSKICKKIFIYSKKF